MVESSKPVLFHQQLFDSSEAHRFACHVWPRQKWLVQRSNHPGWHPQSGHSNFSKIITKLPQKFTKLSGKQPKNKRDKQTDGGKTTIFAENNWTSWFIPLKLGRASQHSDKIRQGRPGEMNWSSWAESCQLGNGWVTDASLPTQWMPHYREGPLPRFTRKLCLYPSCSLAAYVTEWLDTRPNSPITMSGCSSKVLCVWLLPGDICIDMLSHECLCQFFVLIVVLDLILNLDLMIPLLSWSPCHNHRDSGTGGFRPSSKSLAPSSTPEPILVTKIASAIRDSKQIVVHCAAFNIINIICPRLFRYNWQLDPKRDFDSWSSHDTCSRLHELPPCICKSKACSTTAKENTWRQNTQTMQGRHFANDTESQPIQVIFKWNIHHHWFVASLTMKSSCS